MKHLTAITRISFIGSGNVATHLACALHEKSFKVVQVFSRNFDNAELLSKKVEASPTNNLYELDRSADLYLIAVPDSKIKEVIDALQPVDGVVAHTSGSTSLSLLSKAGNYGVFYPLQTFSKEKIVSFKDIPFCIEGNRPEVENSLFKLASELSEDVRLISSDERKYLHLAAVIVNNFTNYMYHIADELLSSQQLDFNILLPLIKESANKLGSVTPENAQTGPARRKDTTSMAQHLKMLKMNPDYQSLYQLISDQITLKYHGKL